jgi:hypothetical protein
MGTKNLTIKITYALITLKIERIFTLRVLHVKIHVQFDGTTTA